MAIRKTKKIRQTKKCAQCSMYSLFCFVNIYFPSFEDVLFYLFLDSGVDKGGKGRLSSPNELKDHPSEKMKSKKKFGGGGGR